MRMDADSKLYVAAALVQLVTDLLDDFLRKLRGFPRSKIQL